MPVLTVVIAAKEPNHRQLIRCVASFAALARAPQIEVLVVLSGTSDVLPAAAKASLYDCLFVETPAYGIYNAYNVGVKHARGTYILFFGVDDLALPPLDDVIERIFQSNERPFLLAAGCHMQQKGVVLPSKRPVSLVFGNWCHQGLLYLRDYLVDHPYDEQYKIRADHKMNIDITSDKRQRFMIDEHVIAYFSSGGTSSLQADLAFRRDFPSIVSKAFGRSVGLFVKLRQSIADVVHGPAETRTAQDRKSSTVKR